MSCDCDGQHTGHEITNVPGLDHVRRQAGSFDSFRRAMLHDAGAQPPFAGWSVHDDDLGLMLIEMWAYAADVVSFYDEVIANEAYLRTAVRRPALRRLVDLIGYRPRPAVAAQVALALLADGVKPITVPAGTRFRSGAFDDEAPQIFEATADTDVYGRTSAFALAAPPVTTLDDAAPTVLRMHEDATVTVEDLLLIRYANADATTFVRTATAVADATDSGGDYVALTLDAAIALGSNAVAADIRVRRPSQQAGLWTMADMGSNPSAIARVDGVGVLTLDGLYRQIRAGQYVILASDDGDARWFRVTKVAEERLAVAAGASFTIDGEDVTTEAATAPVTRLTLDTTVNASARRGRDTRWTSSEAGSLVVHYAFVDAGAVTLAPKARIEDGDPLAISGTITAPADGFSPTTFLAVDADETGLAFTGAADLAAGTIAADDADLGTGLVLPVTVYGNVIAATRGETVTSEVLGSGDASVANQSFTLKKSPLTYLSAPSSENADGVASTLRVWVDGVEWSEVDSFYGAGPSDQVFIVRHDDDEHATMTFGDGVRGSRLPSGSGNVVASYRFGAGEAAPPAASITQLAKAITGISAVKNPVAAYGGADAESADDIRELAPRSALLLGRAVSLADLTAVATGVAGVRAVAVDWRWNRARQRPVAQVAYIGDASLQATIVETLRSVSEPTLAVAAQPATAIAVDLAVTVAVDPRYVDETVLEAVRVALLDEDDGLLIPERIGIGAPLFRSRVLAAVLGVAGAQAVTAITWTRTADASPAAWAAPAKSPGAGAYFDFESGTLTLSAQEASA